jgi:hypothetical protein
VKKSKFRAFFDPRLLCTTHNFLPMTHNFLPMTHNQNSNSNQRAPIYVYLWRISHLIYLILLFWLKNVFIKYVIHNIVIHCRVPKCRPYWNVIVAIATTMTSFLLIIPNSTLYKSHNSRFLTLKQCVVKMWNIKYIIWEAYSSNSILYTGAAEQRGIAPCHPPFYLT